MKLRLSEDAQQDIERIDAWWRENRPAAPLLFRQELRDAMDLLETHPECGTPYKTAKKTYRRVVLPKTRYLLYYEYDKEADLLAVTTIWSARRGSGPKL
ncbi:MAG: type II toxin-antitoxin system RelE/ParE family toxin [Polyangiaceae bacterium]|nr:type II toxin-antitoxin system RelE/ParE family toxin [Polyangiaceae bacterium]